MPDPVTPDPVTPDSAAAYLAEVREREQAATPGPWWSDEDELMWRLHGVHAIIPAQMGGLIPEQVMNHQIAKAPKSGTPYAEYWPNAADDAFIVAARSDVPRLAAAVEAVLAVHVRQEQPVRHYGLGDACPKHHLNAFGRPNYATFRDCPDCRYTEYYVCSHCQCPHDNWPCPTYRAITTALTGGTGGH